MFAFWLLFAEALSFPSWLQFPPDVAVATQQSPGLIEKSVRLPGKPTAVAAWFEPQFTSRGLRLAASADGIGLAARVKSPECDLLIQFHPAGAEATVVRVYCSDPAPPPSDFYVPPATAQRTFPRMPAEDRYRDFEAATRRKMETYDRPTPVNSQSFYHDDAPPLVWPGWLTLMGAPRGTRPQAARHDGHACLSARYETVSIPMTKLVYGYEDLLRANGFPVPNVHLETGQTITGAVIQNKNGRVEGSLSTNGRVNGPSTRINASFNRHVLNGPIQVSVRVCSVGSFGRQP